MKLLRWVFGKKRINGDIPQRSLLREIEESRPKDQSTDEKDIQTQQHTNVMKKT